MIILYKAGNDQDHNQLGAKLRKLKAGKEYVIELTENKPIRSLDQNKYYWLCLKVIALDTGIDKDRLHEFCKSEFNSEEIEFKNGAHVSAPRSTKNLRTDEFAIYINKVKAWAKSFHGIVIRDRKDITYEYWISISKDYDRTYQFQVA